MLAGALLSEHFSLIEFQQSKRRFSHSSQSQPYTLNQNFTSSPSGPESEPVDESSPVRRLPSASNSTSSASSPPPTEDAEKTQSTNQETEGQDDHSLSDATDEPLAAETAPLESPSSEVGTEASDSAFDSYHSGEVQQEFQPSQSSNSAVESAPPTDSEELDFVSQASAPFATAPESSTKETSTESIQNLETRREPQTLQQTSQAQGQPKPETKSAPAEYDTEALPPASTSSREAPQRHPRFGGLSVSSLSRPPSQPSYALSVDTPPHLDTPSELANMSQADASESIDASDLEAKLSEIRNKAASNANPPQIEFGRRRRKSSQLNIASPHGRTRSPSLIPHSAPEPKAPDLGTARLTVAEASLPEKLHEPAPLTPQIPRAQVPVDYGTTQSESQDHVDTVSRNIAPSELEKIADEVIDEQLEIHDSIDSGSKGKQPVYLQQTNEPPVPAIRPDDIPSLKRPMVSCPSFEF